MKCQPLAAVCVLAAIGCDSSPPSNPNAPLRSTFSAFEFPSSNADDYLRVDSLGVPFVDTVLGERADEWNLGAMNLDLQFDFLRRFAHMGFGFTPAFKAAGIDTCFANPGDKPQPFKYIPEGFAESARITHTAAQRVSPCLLQRVRMADDRWRRTGAEVPLPMVVTLFHPNTLMIDLDTTGTFPFGLRPEDQIASRFIALFLDMKGNCNGKPCNIDSLQDPAVHPGFPLNPPQNDKPFPATFPYLAEPWPVEQEVR